MPLEVGVERDFGTQISVLDLDKGRVHPQLNFLLARRLQRATGSLGKEYLRIHMDRRNQPRPQEGGLY